jgi:hypothetical protein
MKNIQKQIEDICEDMKEVAMEIIDGLDIENDIGDDYTCFIDKELYDYYLKLNDKRTNLQDKLKADEAKQLKFALKK